MNTQSLQLSINVGSSNIKLAIFSRVNERPTLIKTEKIERNEAYIISQLKQFIADNVNDISTIKIVSHRFVLLDKSIKSPCIISSKTLQQLKALGSLAPLHNPLSILLVDICHSLFAKNTVQTLHADTDFFKPLPALASDHALPKTITDKYDLSKRGFHGLAHRSMLQSLKKWQNQHKQKNRFNKVISIQLGSGCSICAIKDDMPIDISMGYSTIGGLIMASRSGDLDPGILLFLQSKLGLDSKQLEDMLSNQSGLLGLTSYSGNLQQICQNQSVTDRHAIEMYCYRIRKYLGAYIAVLGGIDCIVLGGGVAENNSLIRSMIFQNWQWLGLELNKEKNHQISNDIVSIEHDNSIVKVFVCKVDEENIMATDALKLINSEENT